MRTGWANNCGVELFTHGWVTCEQALETLSQDYGGKQFNSNFLVFQPVIKTISESIPVSEEVLTSSDTVLGDIEFSYDDKIYGLQLDRPAEQVLNGLQNIDEILDKAISRVSVPRERVKQKLIQEVEQKIQEMRDFKAVVFRDDEEIIEILFMAEEL